MTLGGSILFIIFCVLRVQTRRVFIYSSSSYSPRHLEILKVSPTELPKNDLWWLPCKGKSLWEFIIRNQQCVIRQMLYLNNYISTYASWNFSDIQLSIVWIKWRLVRQNRKTTILQYRNINEHAKDGLPDQFDWKSGALFLCLCHLNAEKTRQT